MSFTDNTFPKMCFIRGEKKGVGGGWGESISSLCKLRERLWWTVIECESFKSQTLGTETLFTFLRGSHSWAVQQEQEHQLTQENVWNPPRQISGCWEWASSASVGSKAALPLWCCGGQGGIILGQTSSSLTVRKNAKKWQQRHTSQSLPSVSFVLGNRDEHPGNWGALMWLHVSRRGRTHSNIRSQSLVSEDPGALAKWLTAATLRQMQSVNRKKKRLSASHLNKQKNLNAGSAGSWEWQTMHQ